VHYPGIAHLLRTRLVGVARDFDPDTPWVEYPIVMIDVETTGRDPASDHVVELAVVRGEKGEVISRNAWLINPGCPIPEESVSVHGIRDEDVKDKPAFAAVSAEILRALRGALPAAYNASFDRGFLLAETRRAQTELPDDVPSIRDDVVWIDPLVWARHLMASAKSRKLADVAERLGVELEQAHRATADAEAALRVLYSLGDDERIPATYGALIHEQVRIGRAQEEARQMWRR
jgi:DNA polymerase-3 subunit epsilon